MEQEDTALFRSIAAGDTGAMEAFFKRYKAAVYRYAMSMLQDGHAAENVTQEVFLRVFHFAHQFTGASGGRTWLYAAARSAVTEYWRERPLEEPYTAVRKEAAVTELTEESTFYEMMSVLDWPSRNVVAMHVAGGLKHREIAAILGESESAVRQRYARAIRQLRRQLEKEGSL